MPRYDYRCGCGDVTEALAGLDEDTRPCPACGKLAKRVPVNYFVYANTETGGHSFPRLNNAKSEKGKYRVSDFVEASSEIAHEAEKVEKREGKPVKVPDFYRAGLKKAEKMGAKRNEPRQAL